LVALAAAVEIKYVLLEYWAMKHDNKRGNLLFAIEHVDLLLLVLFRRTFCMFITSIALKSN
jgi:hypothetical protein